jgi:hypothetical protein
MSIIEQKSTGLSPREGSTPVDFPPPDIPAILRQMRGYEAVIAVGRLRAQPTYQNTMA